MENYLPSFKMLTLFLLMTATCLTASAQGREVSGTVTSRFDNEPLPGVAIQVKGTTRGTTTDLDGTYTLSLEDGDNVLVYSFIGFKSVEIEVGNRSNIDMALEESVENLQEAVVIGYGSQDRKEITSAVTSVGAAEFNRGNIVHPTQLLQGKVAGLSVTRPGGNPNAAPTMRLRGISSFGATQEPLVVLDGVIGASMDAVDPNDIESIDILKDASAAAIYGTRGAAGVILITTRRGAARAGITNVTVNTFSSADQATNLIPVLSADEFVERGGVDYGTRTDWRDEILRTAINGTMNVSVSGGFENTAFMASVNYRNNQGVVRGTDRETLNTRLNLNHGAFNNRLRFNVNLAFTNTEANDVSPEAVRYATIFNPTAPIYEDTPEANQNFGGYFQRPLFDFYNPVALINQQRFNTEIKNALYSYRIEYDIFDNLTIATQFSQDRLNRLEGSFFSRQDFNTGFGRFGQAGQNMFDRNQTIWNGTIRFQDEIFPNLDFTMLAGAETQIFEERGFSAASTRYLFDQGFNNLGAGGLRFGPGTEMNSFATRAVLNSLFGRANLNYNNQYFFSATLRAETYSGFGADYQTGFFPAATVGADLSQITTMGPFSQFKVRGSFGVTGQLPPSPTLALGIFGLGNRIPLNPEDPIGSVFVGINQVSNPNPQLKWETTREINVGLDYGLFLGKVTGSIDYWVRNISDLLFNTAVPVGAPNEFMPGNFYTAPFIWANIADLSSAGFEFATSVNNMDLGRVKWTPSLNFTIYRRTTIDNIGVGSINLPEIRQATPGSPGQNNNPIIWNRVGERIGNFYGPRFLGLDEAGEYILSGETPDEFENLGSALPTADFGFANTFLYGNWDLNFLFRGSYGHLIYNSFRGFYENADGASNTWNSVITDNTPANVTATPTFSDLYLERGDFIRLDNLQLGYNITTRTDAISSFRVYTGVQNLFTLTNFTGVDPEVRWTDTEDPANPNPLAPGLERRNTYFLPRIWTVGLTLTFR